MWRRTFEAALVAMVLTGTGFAGPSPSRITVLYDNSIAKPGVKAAWGFACLVEAHGHTVLFDTGGDPAVLKDNLAGLDLGTAGIEAVVISHVHGDHTFGAPGLAVPKGTSVYTPHRFTAYPAVTTALTSAGLAPVPVTERRTLFDGLAIAAPMPFGPLPAGGSVAAEERPWEEVLLVDTPRGLVVLVGCAHPGIVEMLDEVRRSTGRPIHMAVGGFHLLQKSLPEARAIAAMVRSLGVAHAGPTHCTGDDATFAFREAYGDAFVAAGVGRVIEIPPAAPAAR